MKELVVFTHSDLDAAGCVLNIEFKLPSIPKKYFYTNYGDIEKITQEVIQYIKENNIQSLLMADVSFATNKECLAEIMELGIDVTLIDHHQYPEDFFSDFPSLKLIHDTSKSATLLCNEYLKNTGKNENLDKLTKIIDVYDIWQINDPKFNFAQDLNEYFWRYSIPVFCKGVQEAGWNLPHDFLPVVRHIRQEYTNGIKDYEERGLIQRGGKITLCFGHDWFNQILIREMNQGQDFVIGLSSYGIIKVRISEKADYTNEQKRFLMKELTGKITGHENAFTYKMKSVSFDKLINESQRIAKIIQNLK